MFHRDDGEVMFLMNVTDQFIDFLGPFWIESGRGLIEDQKSGG